MGGWRWVGCESVGRGGQALGWSTGWLVASAGVDGWVDRDPGGRLRGEGRVGGKRWLGCLCVSRVGTLCPSTPPSPIPRYLGHRTRSTRALPVQLPPQNAPHRDDVCGCVRRVCSICVCMFICVYTCERSRALIYVAPMCYTLQTSPPYTRGYSMCRICS